MVEIKVRIISRGDAYYNKVGRVTSQDEHCVGVKFDDNEHSDLYARVSVVFAGVEFVK